MKKITRRSALLSIAALSQAWRLGSALPAFSAAPQSLLQHTAVDSNTVRKPLNQLQLAVVNLRFGMFICLSPTSYLDLPDQLMPDHAPPRQGKDGIYGTADDLSPALMNPTKLDCGQWADVAKSAKMQFGVLVTKHHDGFCLWPSKRSTYTVAQGCKRDVVGEYASAFRSRGLKVALYYSIRDRTEGISADAKSGGVSPAKIQLIKDQLTELLTNYGEILYIVFDGWGNVWHESPTFSQIHYDDIYKHIKSIQPNCLVMNHSRIRYVSDMPHLELRAGMELPTGGDWPAVGGNTVQEAWFWRTTYPTSPLRSVDWIVNKNLIPDNKCNLVFLLNCAPNRYGLMDDNVVARMAEVGKAWFPPEPLKVVPDSWKNWPVPDSVHLFSGKNIALGKPVRISPNQTAKSPGCLVDGNPDTFVDLSATDTWIEIDLGKNYPLAGVHLWNRSPAHNVMLEQGFIFVSDTPFTSGDPAGIQKQLNVKSIAISEAPGYPTPYPISASGRHLGIVSTSGREIGIGEVEVFAK